MLLVKILFQKAPKLPKNGGNTDKNSSASPLFNILPEQLFHTCGGLPHMRLSHLQKFLIGASSTRLGQGRICAKILEDAPNISHLRWHDLFPPSASAIEARFCEGRTCGCPSASANVPKAESFSIFLPSPKLVRASSG